MRLAVSHRTVFEFDQPSGYSIHDVRLTPKPANGQRVLAWRIDGPGNRADWTDGHGNAVTTFSTTRPHARVEIVVEGVYEVSDAGAWLQYAEAPTLPPSFWLRNFGQARHDASFDPLVATLGKETPASGQVAALHALMRRVCEAVSYRRDVSTVDTSAIEALRLGAGVAQDQAHVFIAACRRAGVPARYVSGYLRNDDASLHVGRTSHSWAEAWIGELGWVGFDPANEISPRGDHLKVAIGTDYRDASPVAGRRIGFGEAKMSVDAEVRRID
ncbi:MAG: transglutaminase family protein [Alphaproteobacteria bacterium]|nr:transglutaminase family protein [Alphaproteobacteria bacterium]